jgi:uncharacterized protein
MTTLPKATIAASEVRTMKSKRTGLEYRISVALPNSYDSQLQRQYPTIYLTDANWHFGMVTDLTRVTSRGPALSEAIVVGIGYAVDDDGPSDVARTQVLKLRTQDLTPVTDRKMVQDTARLYKEDIKTGGANKFLKFIQTELIPVIEANYRANSTDRILVGHSLGGLFALFALFQEPRLFRGYVAADPSIGYADKAMLAIEGRFARSHKALPAKLYMAVGELGEVYPYSDMVSGMIQFAARLESRHYKGFTLTKQIHANCDHGSVVAPAFQAGLLAVMG